jgi:membrane-associated protein
MNTLHDLLNFILHLDQNLVALVTQYGVWIYALLFAIIFCETGLVVLPLLPGDSLLFSAGIVASGTEQALNIHWLFLLLVLASVAGNTLNYTIGRWLGPQIFHSKKSFWFNPAHLTEAHKFCERHGGKAIVIARFVPIIRTFAPFVAGIGYMNRRRFFSYNLAGALLWIGSLLYISYWFGNLPIIKNHFSTIILSIVVLSLLPPAVIFLKRKCV